MSDVSKVAETAEAICGALYRLDFQVLGETDNGASTWFTRGTKPQIMRVEVARSRLAAYVMVNVEHPNVSGPTFMRVRQAIQINCGGARERLIEATEAAVLRVLELYRDLLAGTGLAGPEELKKATTGDTAIS